MRATLTRAVVAIALLVGVPALASAQTEVWSNVGDGGTCGGSTLQACVGFTLLSNGSTDVGGTTVYHYLFRTEYLSTTQTWAPNQGVITAAGLYDPDGLPDFDFFDVALVYPPVGWGAYDGSASNCQHLNGAGSTIFEACADTDNGVNYGLGLGEYVTFSFSTTTHLNGGMFANNSSLADVGARAHFQSYGSNECSFKLDTRLGVVSPPEGGIDACGNVVPEPGTVLLLATGLLGIGAVGVRRRRREEEADA